MTTLDPGGPHAVLTAIYLDHLNGSHDGPENFDHHCVSCDRYRLGIEVDRLKAELEAAREENRQLHARTDELEGVEAELKKSERKALRMERYAAASEAHADDETAALARARAELAVERARQSKAYLDLFDEAELLRARVAELEAEVTALGASALKQIGDELEARAERMTPVVEAAKAWRVDANMFTIDGFEKELIAAVDALGPDAPAEAGAGGHPGWLIDLINAAVLAQEAEDECDWTPQGNCTEECAWCGWERLLEALPADVRDAAHRHLNRVPAASPAGSSTADEGDGRG